MLPISKKWWQKSLRANRGDCMLLIRRLFANIVDIVAFLVMVVVFFMYAIPPFIAWLEVEYLEVGWAVASLILLAAAYFGLQYPFMKNNQTLGKAFFGLMIISTSQTRELSVGVILQRELLVKIMTAYTMCLPVFVGREGKHDVACETQVVTMRQQ